MPVLRQGDVVEGGEGLGWEVVKRIGEGQFSEVYQVQDMRTQEQVRQDGVRRAAAALSGGEAQCPAAAARSAPLLLSHWLLAATRTVAAPHPSAHPPAAPPPLPPQRALKIEKRAEVRTVRQEWKVLKRLQATCRQTVRVFEGGEHPWPGGCCLRMPPAAAAAAAACRCCFATAATTPLLSLASVLGAATQAGATTWSWNCWAQT